MQSVLFTKLFGSQSLDDVGATARDLGFSGIDLLLRNGFQVEPDRPEAVRSAIRQLKGAGLTVPMVTTDLTNPAQLPTEALFQTCAEEDVHIIRLGYWKYDPEKGYQACFDAARRDLNALEAVAQKAGIKLAIQLHGGTIHSSGPLAAALVRDHNPDYLGVYPDPGNQSVQEGRENWRLTFDLLQPWLCCIGVKNGGWFPRNNAASGQRVWKSDWLGIADGMVPWDAILAYLVSAKYDGLLSFHSHYELPLAQVYDQTRMDLRYVQRQIATHVDK